MRSKAVERRITLTFAENGDLFIEWQREVDVDLHSNGSFMLEVCFAYTGYPYRSPSYLVSQNMRCDEERAARASLQDRPLRHLGI